MRSWSVLACAVLLSACRSDKTSSDDSGEVPAGATDADSDGYEAGEDCDDEDAQINPGAAELCDGTDNNCDGEIDEGVTATFYADTDGDGFGDEGNTIEACELPDRLRLGVGNDCDDRGRRLLPQRPRALR